MSAENIDDFLPEGTLFYREYEAKLPDDTRTTVTITLGNLSDASASAVRARFRAAFRPRTRIEIEGLSENPPTLH